MIDRTHLRYLLAVVDYGSFTRAAAACGVSQPSLSAGILRLEQEVGATLLLRNNRRVEVTGAGARWVTRARRIEREFTLGEQEVRLEKFRDTLRIGVLSTLPRALLEQALRQAVASGEQMRIEMIEADQKTLISLLDRERIDLAIGCLVPGRERYCEAFFTEDYLLAMPPAHPLATQREVHPEALLDCPMLVRRNCEALAETSRFFTAHGVRPFMAARTHSDDLALVALRSGLGLTVLPASYRCLGATLLPLVGFGLQRRIGFIWRQIKGERPQSPAIEALRQSLTMQHASEAAP